MCLIILVGVRVTNVFVPIYSKKIVDALTEKIFAWQLILAFVGLKLIQGELFLKNFIISFFWITYPEMIKTDAEKKLPLPFICLGYGIKTILNAF